MSRPAPRLSDEIDAEAEHLKAMAKQLACPALLYVAARLALKVGPIRRLEITLAEIVAHERESAALIERHAGHQHIIDSLLPPRGCHLRSPRA